MVNRDELRVANQQQHQHCRILLVELLHNFRTYFLYQKASIVHNLVLHLLIGLVHDRSPPLDLFEIGLVNVERFEVEAENDEQIDDFDNASFIDFLF